MGLFQRVSDIVSANLNDLVDRCEDPEKMLRQAIREVEAAIDQAMDAAARAIASEKLLVKELAHHEEMAAGLLKQAEQAVERGDLDRARRALRAKIEHQRLHRSLEGELESATGASQAIHRQVEAMRGKLAEARRKLALYSARKRVAQARRRFHSGRNGLRTEAFARFERMEERIRETEAEAEAMAEVGGRGGACEPGDEEARRELEVEEELAALKAKWPVPKVR